MIWIHGLIQGIRFIKNSKTILWKKQRKNDYCMKKGFDFILDKILRFLILFERPPKDDGYIYERDFLGIVDYGKDIAEIFRPVTEKVNNDFEEIYNIKTSLYHESVVTKLKYYVENKFWGLFSLVSFDGYELSNIEYFEQNSIMVYLIVNTQKEKNIIVVKSQIKHFEVIASYKKVNTSIRNFKERKLVYSIERGFTSL